ncbi:uncharacterized protein LOC134266072 [Saccostrea cucullata]|uniref:uncharacterized protein LOC134266072 n=1 Tax=Saccostrea cuccullata TaxID=36930 RepID=UPI002ECFF8C5
MDICPYDNVEFPVQRQGGIDTWEGVSGYSGLQTKSYNQTVVRDKVTSSLAPVFENDDGSTEDNSEIPKVEDQRQQITVTPASAPVNKKETAVSFNKGVYVVNNSNQANNHKPQPIVKTSPKPPPSPSLSSMAKDTKTVVIEQPRSIATAFTRVDFNPRSQEVLETAYTRHKHFYKLNETLLDQVNDMKENVWDVKGRPGEMLTYEQLIQGMLEEGEMLVLGGSWLYYNNIDFLDAEGVTSLKPSIGKGRLCLTNQRLLILSAENVLDANLAEYGDPTRTDGGYRIQVSKYNSVYIQNLPLASIQGVELSVSVGTAEESRVSIRNPICDGLCACFGIGRCATTWRTSDPLPVLINKRVLTLGVKMPPWLTKTLVVIHLNQDMPLNMARDFVAKLHHHAPLYNERAQGYTSV